MLANLFIYVMLGIGTNIDNLGIGVAYGIKKFRIGLISNLLIAFFNASGTLISMAAGEKISKYLSLATASYLGNGIIVLIGVWGLITTCKFSANGSEIIKSGALRENRLDQSATPAAGGITYIGMKESIPLAFALSISNLGMGIGAGIAGYDIVILTFVMFVFSMLGISIGQIFGTASFRLLPGRWPGVVSGVMLIALGLYEIISG